MTSFLINGYFAVSGGRRVSSENPNTHKVTHHVLYNTIVQTSGVDLNAEIRTWSPANEALLPDGTVVDLLAKVFAPPNATLLLDAFQMTAFPGDPQSAVYEDNIPDRPFPTFFVLGHTHGLAETMDDTVSVGYFVQTSDYVRDQTRSSRVYCRFDGGKPRWKKTPRPQPGVPVFIVGLAHGVHLSSGSLLLDVDQVQLNVGGTATSASAPRVEAGGAPVKRRKFPVSAAGAPAEGSGTGNVSGAPQSIPGAGTVLPAPETQTVESKAGTAAASRAKRALKRKLILDEAEEE